MELTLRELTEARAYVAQLRTGTREIGLKQLGRGISGMAYLLPSGKVLKFGLERDYTSGYIMEAAKAYRKYGVPPSFAPAVWYFEPVGTYQWWAIMEFVTVAASLNLTNRLRSSYHQQHPAKAEALVEFMRRRGVISPMFREQYDVTWMDDHHANWGVTADGRYVCFDPGSSSTPAKMSVVGSVAPGKRTAQWKRPALQNVRFH